MTDHQPLFGRRLFLVIVALVTGLGAAQAPLASTLSDRKVTHQPPMVSVTPGDSEVNTAIEEARRSLPYFWKLFERHPRGVDSYNAKIAFPTPGGGDEHIWIEVLSHSGDDVVGIINNDPEIRLDLKAGMRVTVKEANVSDWMYRRGGRLYGNFTTRVLLKHLSPSDAAQTLKMLSPTPLEH